MRLLLCFSLLAAHLSCGVVDAQTFSLPKQIYAKPGDTIYIDIAADALIRGVGGVNFLLDYHGKQPTDAPPLIPGISDPQNSTEVHVGTMIPNPILAIDLRHEQIDVALVSLDTDRYGNGPGTVVSVPLIVPSSSSPGTRYALQLLKHFTVDTKNQPILTRATPGFVVVDLHPPIQGDLNDDGAVNVIDAQLALMIATQVIQPTPRQLYAADLPPRKGRVTVQDVVGILRMSVGIPF